MTNLKRMYNRAPVWAQNLVCTLQGQKLHSQRHGGDFDRILAQYNERTFATVDEIMRVREARLRGWYQEVAGATPYMCNGTRLELAGLRESASNLGQIIDKQHLRANLESFTTGLRNEPRIETATGGTTGAGLAFMTTRRAIREQWAVWWRYRGWHGIQPGTWCAVFSGSPVVPIEQKDSPFWRYDWARKQLFFSGFHMSPSNLDAYIHQLNHARPKWIHGYPSMIALLAQHVLNSRIKIEYEIRWITTGAEALLPNQVEAITAAFGVEPLQHYGMSEGVCNVSQCPEGKLHVDEDFSYVEFIPNSDGTHDVVGTAFTNTATVFLRYRVGDKVILSNDVCTCGRPGRIVDALLGRTSDFLVLKSGARVGTISRLFKHFTSIAEAQFEQSMAGSATAKIVKGASFTSADEKKFLASVADLLGQDFKLKIDYVDRVPRTPHGKIRLVVSDVVSPV